jgi:hypothetical protein
MLQNKTMSTRSTKIRRIHLPEMTLDQRQAAKRLVQRWAEDESGYDEEAWPVVKEAIEQNRSSSRASFDG